MQYRTLLTLAPPLFPPFVPDVPTRMPAHHGGPPRTSQDRRSRAIVEDMHGGRRNVFRRKWHAKAIGNSYPLRLPPPRRSSTLQRKLLLNKGEIRKLIGKTVERGCTLVPVRMYFRSGRVKVAVSIAKGKKTHDKRETIRRREIDRETRAMVKGRGR